MLFSQTDEYPRRLNQSNELLQPATYGRFSVKYLDDDEDTSIRLDSPTKPQTMWIDIPNKTEHTQHVSHNSEKPAQPFAHADIISTSQAHHFVQTRYPTAHVTQMTTHTLQNDGCAVFSVEFPYLAQRLVCRIFFRAQPRCDDIIEVFRTISRERPSFYPTIEEEPQTHNNIFFVEENYDHRYHEGQPLLELITTVSYGERGAKSLCVSLAEVVEFFHQHNFVLCDYSASNFRVWRDDDGFHVTPIDVRRAISLDLIDAALKEGEDQVDWVKAGLPQDMVVPELHALEMHRRLAIEMGSEDPSTYIALRPVDVFQMGLTWLQVILQEPHADDQIRSVIRQVTPLEWRTSIDEKENDDCYFVRMADVLRGLFDQNTVCLADDEARAELLEYFELHVFGCIEQESIEQYKSQIISSRLDIDDALERVTTPNISFLGYIFEPTNEENEDSIIKLLQLKSGVDENWTKRSSQNQYFGNKSCMTIQAEIDNDPAIFRIFCKTTNRGQHVLRVYDKIMTEQNNGNADALRSFPRVHGIDTYANVFVVREEWIDGMDLLDHMNEKVRYIPDDLYRKLEQVSLVHGVTRAVELLHRWGIAHDDISADNFMVNKKTGNVMLVDMESATTFGVTDCFEFSSLGIWDKRDYRAPEVEYCLWKKQQPKPPEIFMSLRTNDTFSSGVLVMQILTLHPLGRENCLIARGKNNTVLVDQVKFFHMISGHLAAHSYGTGETPFENDILRTVFGEQFWVENERSKEFVRARRPTMKWLVEKSGKLLDYWLSESQI